MDNLEKRNDELTRKPLDRADLQTTDELADIVDEQLEQAAGGSNGSAHGQP